MAEEKILNPRLSKSLNEFVNIMNNLNLSYPKMIGMLIRLRIIYLKHYIIFKVLFENHDKAWYFCNYYYFLNFYKHKILFTLLDKALPANKVCGLYEVHEEQKPWRDELFCGIFTFIDRPMLIQFFRFM